MTNETILQIALGEALEFITTLMDRKPDDVIDLLSMAGVGMENMLKESLERVAPDSATQAYLSNDGNNCPYCGGSAATSSPIEADGRIAWQGCYCEDCGKEWNDQYELIGFDDPNN